jgi:hypothetical protein
MPVLSAAGVTPLRPIQGVTVVKAKICKNKTSDRGTVRTHDSRKPLAARTAAILEY